MDLKATSSMLQLLPLDSTRRWLCFCRHHLPSQWRRHRDPSPAVLTPRCRRRMVQKPSQTGPLPTSRVSLVAGFVSCHCVRCSTAFSMFVMIVDWCKGERTTVEGTPGMARALIIWAEKWQNSKPKKKTNFEITTKEKQVGKNKRKSVHNSRCVITC